MRLQEMASSGLRVGLVDVSQDRELATDLQDRLSLHGVLDPPTDAQFGLISHWALAEFRRRIGAPPDDPVDSATANALLRGPDDSPFPLKGGDDLAGRILKAMVRKGHWFSRHPGCVNIVYVEGIDPDGTPNDDAPNIFNDLRLVLRVSGTTGMAEIVDKWDGTTEPGRFFTENPEHPKGAARIAFGQFKAWSVGTHRAGQSGAHEALVQTAPITVFRDLDRNFDRQGDTPDTGLFGINQHWGFDLPKDNISNASAGCLIGRTKPGHRVFMTIVKSDARFRVNQGYRFLTTILDKSDLI